MSIRSQLERDIIAAILWNPDAFPDHSRFLLPAYFTGVLEKKIMQAVHECFSNGWPITTTDVANAGRFSSEEVSGFLKIDQHQGDLSLLGRRLAEEVIHQRFLAMKDRITPQADVFDLLREAQVVSNEASALITAHAEPDKHTLLENYTAYLLANAEHGVKRIATGFPTLDRMLGGGLTPGDISFIGGPPGSGKTSFMLQLALAAAKAGVHTCFLEDEMPVNEVLERLNGIAADVAVDLVRNGKDFHRVSQPFIAQLHDLPLDIVPCYERTVETLVNRIRRAIHDGSSLIFVDYLQVFTPKGRTDDEFSQIKALSEILRQLALQNAIHLCVASSLNRNEFGQQKLSLASLYGGAQLGHDCAVAMILSGEQSDQAELITHERQVCLQVVKNRSGVRGDIAFHYDLARQQLEEVTAGAEAFQSRSAWDSGEQGADVF